MLLLLLAIVAAAIVAAEQRRVRAAQLQREVRSHRATALGRRAEQIADAGGLSATRLDHIDEALAAGQLEHVEHLLAGVDGPG